MFNYIFFGKKMDEKGFTCKALAEKVGVSDALISYLRNGYKVPSLVLASRLAKELDCTIDDLVRGGETSEYS